MSTVLRCSSVRKTESDDKNRIKIINKKFTFGLSIRFLVLVKFRALRCANVTV